MIIDLPAQPSTENDLPLQAGMVFEPSGKGLIRVIVQEHGTGRFASLNPVDWQLVAHFNPNATVGEFKRTCDLYDFKLVGYAGVKP